MPDQTSPFTITDKPSDSLGDIQGIVLYGYGHLPHARHLLLQVTDAAQGRAWLSGVLPFVTDARYIDQRSERYGDALNIAFTALGLSALGREKDELQLFPDEFRDGMSQPYRARQLGDNGSSDPKNWPDFGGADPATGLPDPAKQPHILLMLFGKDRARLDAVVARERARMEQAAGAITVLYDQDGIEARKSEHFGFHDGISNPVIAGAPSHPRPGDVPVAAGEFILGYPNAYGTYPFSPSVPEARDVTNALPPARLMAVVGTREIATKVAGATDDVLAGRKDLGRNGSYLVYRKLEQDVAGFWRYCSGQGAGDPDEQLRIASKMVGRWPSGASLTQRPSGDDEALGADPQRNGDFGYADADALGRGCPLGAHVRRANPRDHLTSSKAESLLITSRHRLLRRGRTYGPPMESPRSGVDDGAKRGLVFICIGANIARQFEFVQQTWLNNPKFHGLFYDRDPVTGDGVEPQTDSGVVDIPSRFTIPADPVRRRLNDVPRFVTVRAGAYFFVPSISALCFLAGVPRAERPTIGSQGG